MLIYKVFIKKKVYYNADVQVFSIQQSRLKKKWGDDNILV